MKLMTVREYRSKRREMRREKRMLKKEANEAFRERCIANFERTFKYDEASKTYIFITE